MSLWMSDCLGVVSVRFELLLVDTLDLVGSSTASVMAMDVGWTVVLPDVLAVVCALLRADRVGMRPPILFDTVLSMESTSLVKPSGDFIMRRRFESLSVVLSAASLVVLFKSICDSVALLFFTLSLLCTRFLDLLLTDGSSTLGTSGRFDRVRDPMDLHVRRLVGFAMMVFVDYGVV